MLTADQIAKIKSYYPACVSVDQDADGTVYVSWNPSARTLLAPDDVTRILAII